MDGLDANYFRKNLERIARDAESYTPQEMATALTRLADVANGQKMNAKLDAIGEFFRRPPVTHNERSSPAAKRSGAA